jgi:hypothetical protein
VSIPHETPATRLSPPCSHNRRMNNTNLRAPPLSKTPLSPIYTRCRPCYVQIRSTLRSMTLHLVLHAAPGHCRPPSHVLLNPKPRHQRRRRYRQIQPRHTITARSPHSSWHCSAESAPSTTLYMNNILAYCAFRAELEAAEIATRDATEA